MGRQKDKNEKCNQQRIVEKTKSFINIINKYTKQRMAQNLTKLINKCQIIK